jgi:hypothetical protein
MMPHRPRPGLTTAAGVGRLLSEGLGIELRRRTSAMATWLFFVERLDATRSAQMSVEWKEAAS